MELTTGSCSMEVHWFFQIIPALESVLNQSNLSLNPQLSTGEDVSVTLRKEYVGSEAPHFLIDGTR